MLLFVSYLCWIFILFLGGGGCVCAWDGAFTMWFVMNMIVDIVYPNNGFGRFGVF